MYFVDREKIEKLLTFLDETITTYESQKEWNTVLEVKALERLAHLLIETVLDVGNTIIDGFIMRDPGSYEDIIDILDDEKVITKEQSAELKHVILLRKAVVQEYFELDHQTVITTINENIKALKEFSTAVRRYVATELGPVSAFRN